MVRGCLLQFLEVEFRTAIAGQHPLQADDKRGPKLHEVGALLEQIPGRSSLSGIDVTRGEQAQPEQMGKQDRIAGIVAVFEPVLSMVLGRIGQMYGGTGLL